MSSLCHKLIFDETFYSDLLMTQSDTFGRLRLTISLSMVYIFRNFNNVQQIGIYWWINITIKEKYDIYKLELHILTCYPFYRDAILI